jgi:hypothetical protein
MKLRSPVMGLVGGMLVLIGCGGFVAVVYDYRLAQQAVAWPTTDGVVTENGVRSWQDSERNGNYIRYVTRYAPEVTYAWHVGGVAYEGHRIAIVDDSFDDEADAREVGLVGLGVGDHVTVHYDPASPGTALLDVRSPNEWCLGIGSIGVSALGVFGIVAAFARKF